MKMVIDQRKEKTTVAKVRDVTKTATYRVIEMALKMGRFDIRHIQFALPDIKVSTASTILCLLVNLGHMDIDKGSGTYSWKHEAHPENAAMAYFNDISSKRAGWRQARIERHLSGNGKLFPEPTPVPTRQGIFIDITNLIKTITQEEKGMKRVFGNGEVEGVGKITFDVIVEAA